MPTKNKPGQDESKSWENQEREEWINKILRTDIDNEGGFF
jgi:hypothetical protein